MHSSLRSSLNDEREANVDKVTASETLKNEEEQVKSFATCPTKFQKWYRNWSIVILEYTLTSVPELNIKTSSFKQPLLRSS